MKIAYTLTQSGEGIDAIFQELAERLRLQGKDVRGAIQRSSRDDSGRLLAMDVQVLPDGPTLSISQPLGHQADGCCLDPGALEQAAHHIEQSLTGAVDLLIVPRFGDREAQGGGFRSLFVAAMDAQVPVLAAVNASCSEAFETFAGGLAQRIPPKTDQLHAWAENP